LSNVLQDLCIVSLVVDVVAGEGVGMVASLLIKRNEY